MTFQIIRADASFKSFFERSNDRAPGRRLGGKSAWLILGLAAMLGFGADARTQAPPQSQTGTQPEAQAQTPQTQAQAPPQSQTEPQPIPQPAPETPKTAGAYNIEQTIEVGYRDSIVNGNQFNYDTFQNYQSGFRLFDYSLGMQSKNHQGLLFDDLSLTSFGYGGDPNDVSRLRISKNKWYDFQGTFRRDKNYWNYNLLANPLNPAGFGPVLNSPQALDLTRWMQDYNLTVLPQSRVRVRVGFSTDVSQGPASATVEGGTEPLLSQAVRETTNTYRAGVDYRGLPNTTLSFDETFIHTKVDTSAVDNNLTYQLSNGTPVDLGLVFFNGTPCASPILSTATTPFTANANCNGYLSYSQYQSPRASFPTERASFQSSYFRNFSMDGSASYSSGQNSVPDFNEVINGWTSRTLARGSTTGGPAQANRVLVNADWSGDYRLTDKADLIDEFYYENWRIPSLWATANTSLFGTPPQATGQAGMLLPVSPVTPATFASVCPTAPYNQANCPQHNTSSLADVTDEVVSQFLAQDMKTNTIELKYEFTNRISAHAGYLYTARTIQDFGATFDLGEIYLPGGAAGTAANYYLAARGDCALVGGKLPAGCVLNANGSIQEGFPANPVGESGNDTARNDYMIHENDGLLGIAARPTDDLRINADFVFGYNDNVFTRISPRQVQSYKIHAEYTPAPWASVSTAADINENRDNVYTVDNIEHDRTYSFVTTLAPNQKVSVDFGYNYSDIYTQSEICFPITGPTVFTTPCPVAGASSPLGTLSFYASRQNYAFGDVTWKYKRVTASAGYAGSFVRGSTTFLNPLTPTGTLDFDYLMPRASLLFDIYQGLSYRTAWNYYGYYDRGIGNPAGLAVLPPQGFQANNLQFSFLYSF